MESAGGGLELTKEQAYRFAPPNSTGLYLVHNFDGYLVYYGGDKPQENYVQIFRSGVVEYVMALHHAQQDNRMRVNGAWIEHDIFDVAPRFCALLVEHGLTPPYYFMLSLLGIRNHVFDPGGPYSRTRGVRADRDNVIFPEVAAEDAAFDAPSTLRPLANRLWNTFGYPGSPNYAESGMYVEPR